MIGVQFSARRGAPRTPPSRTSRGVTWVAIGKSLTSAELKPCRDVSVCTQAFLSALKGRSTPMPDEKNQQTQQGGQGGQQGGGQKDDQQQQQEKERQERERREKERRGFPGGQQGGPAEDDQQR